MNPRAGRDGNGVRVTQANGVSLPSGGLSAAEGYRIGYARVSTRGQKEDSQLTDLAAYGCDRVFTDKVSGKLASRPELDRSLEMIRPGDKWVITRLSRAMRSIKHMIEIKDFLQERGAHLVVIRQQMDTSTATGRLMFHFLAAIDEWQRELIVEGTEEGLAAAAEKGNYPGRPRALSDLQEREVRKLVDAQELTIGEIAAMFNVSRPSVYRAVRRGRA